MDQRAVDDVAVADHPADVGSAPIYFTRFDAVEVLHRPAERHAVAAVVAHHALGLTGRARRVEDIERVGRLDGHAVVRLGRRDRLVPVGVAARHQGRRGLRTLQDEAVRDLVRGKLDRLVEQRLVLDDPPRLDAARGGQHQLRETVVDAGRQLVGGKAAEHDGVHRAQPRAGQHRHHRLGDHRHVDDHPVALADARRGDGAGELRHLVAQLAVGEALLCAGDRRIVDQCGLVGAPAFDVAVERVVAGVEFGAGEPTVKRRVGCVEHLVPTLRPVDRRGLLGPESLGIAERTRMHCAVRVTDGHDGVPSPCWEAGLASTMDRRNPDV